MHLHIPTFFQQGDVAPQKQKRSLKSVSQKMATMTKVDMNKKEVQPISQLNNGIVYDIYLLYITYLQAYSTLLTVNQSTPSVRKLTVYTYLACAVLCRPVQLVQIILSSMKILA